MPTFQFEAMDPAGKEIKDVIEAANEEEAQATIRGMGYYVTKISAKKSKRTAEKKGCDGKIRAFVIGGVKSKELTMFTRQLSILQDAGLPILRSLKILEQQSKPGRLKNTLMDVCEDIESGSTLSESMSKCPKVFDRLYVNMIKAGEAGGALELILQRLADFQERAQSLKRKIKGAMIYPGVIISAMVIIGIALAIFVLPSLTATFKDFDTQLPFTTKIVIAFSDFMAGHAVLVIGGLIALVGGAIAGLRTKAGKRLLGGFLLNMPLISPVVKKINMARFARILGSLMKSGISVIQGLHVTSQAMDNVYYRDVLEEAAEAIKVGKPLTEALGEHTKLFPFIVTQMLAIGEETGNLENILDQLAEHFEAEVDDTMKNMSSIIEPMLLLVIGAVVGFLALALISPIYNISNSIQ